MIRLLLRAYSTPLTLPEVVIYTAALLTAAFCILVLAVEYQGPV